MKGRRPVDPAAAHQRIESTHADNSLSGSGRRSDWAGPPLCTLVERYFHTLKVEDARGGAAPTKRLTRTIVFEYVEVFYNLM